MNLLQMIMRRALQLLLAEFSFCRVREKIIPAAEGVFVGRTWIFAAYAVMTYHPCGGGGLLLAEHESFADDNDAVME